MLNTLLIFLGAGFGGLSRYWVSTGIHYFVGRHFPYGTLFVNATGSFLMGLLFVLIIERFDGIGPQLRSLLLIGFLGGYTTFSSFSLETMALFENGAWLGGFLNILLSVVLCLTLTGLGIMVGRQL
ncbi:fluoride efflux transporter CrcB [Legionella dresdenensis]|uniref:Fluoride-specific ion channel FluC n=1 Tax=Legionella dresdenensis TaxID=450200 RepID=A0ABV8CB24_9GAMM